MDALQELGAALDEDSYERLLAAHPPIARGVLEAVGAGVSTVSIHGYVLDRTASPELARWCQRAAVHLQSQRES